MAFLDEGMPLAELVAVLFRTGPIAATGFGDERFHALVLLIGELAGVVTSLRPLGTLVQQAGVFHRDGGEDGVQGNAVVPIFRGRATASRSEQSQPRQGEQDAPKARSLHRHPPRRSGCGATSS